MSHRTTFRLPPPHQQQGIVLIVVLIMLVVIGLVSVNMMRESLSTDQVSNNVRSEALASEAAQIALAYCEAESIKASSTTVTKNAHRASGRRVRRTRCRPCSPQATFFWASFRFFAPFRVP